MSRSHSRTTGSGAPVSSDTRRSCAARSSPAISSFAKASAALPGTATASATDRTSLVRSRPIRCETTRAGTEVSSRRGTPDVSVTVVRFRVRYGPAGPSVGRSSPLAPPVSPRLVTE